MIEMLFKNGTSRIVTFSYDDGDPLDERLIKLFDKYGMKATFNLNSSRVKYHYEDPTVIKKLYENHEVAVHTVNHGWLEKMPNQAVVNEIIEDRKYLESLVGYPVLGMAFPSGSPLDNDKNIREIVKACGILYARTTNSTMSFYVPYDFLYWNTTCHHRDALEVAKKFTDSLDSYWTRPLLYIWGHSHEFKTEEDWEKFENVLKLLANHKQIWYATNMEICSYVKAYKSLQISMDESIFYNPTATDVWVMKNNSEVIKIPAGEKIILN